MKQLILSIATVMFALSGFAQKGSKAQMTAEELATKRAEKLKTELSLSDDQKTKVYAAILERHNKVKAIKEKFGDNKKGMGKELKPVRESFDASMKSILNADQLAKWETLKAQQKEKMKVKKGKGKKAPMDDDIDLNLE